MGMIPIRERSARRSIARSSTAVTRTSTIDWSKTTVASAQRYYPMRGFGNVESAARFCRAFDELRQFFRFRTTMSQSVSLEHQRELFLQRFDALQTLMMA